jgi:hypothetical protein
MSAGWVFCAAGTKAFLNGVRHRKAKCRTNAEQRSASIKTVDVAGTANWDTRNASLGTFTIVAKQDGRNKFRPVTRAKRLHAALAARCYVKLLRYVPFGGGEAMSQGVKRVCRVGVVASLLIVAVPWSGRDGTGQKWE